MAKGFASTGDLGEKKVSFDECGSGLCAYTAKGNPNSGIIVGDLDVLKEAIALAKAGKSSRLSACR